MKLGVWLKIFRVLLGLFQGYWRLVTGFHGLTDEQKSREIEAWARNMLRIMGVQVRTQGQPASGPVLMAANHISWLDILVMLAASHCRFVAKADIRHWPVLGTLTTGVGSLYIARESSRDAMRVVHQMAAALQNGDVLAVFPEGTTGDGLRLLPFHANLLQAAISADVPIQPIALRFVDAATGQPSLAPCYIGEDTLVGSIWRTLTAPPLIACVTYGKPEMAEGKTRREWAQSLHACIAALL